MKNMTYKALVLALAVGATGTVAALPIVADYHNGALGAESAAKFDIYYTKVDSARIWGLKDIHLKDGTATDSRKACVFSTGIEGAFKLEIDSANEFELVTGVTGEGTVPYILTIEDHYENSVADGSATNMKAGLFNVQPDANEQSCDVGKENLDITVALNGGNPNPAVNAGVYSDTITLTVSPI